MKISQSKKEKIQEQILAYLFSISPSSTFTSKISLEIARDEEFVKKLLFDLKKKGLVLSINKNPKGDIYIRRLRWKMSPRAYDIYKKRQ